jgi:hypothetical protein
MPRLAFPLAVTGAAAGWLTCELLDNPVMGRAWPTHAGGIAAGVSAVIGAVVGLALQASCTPREGRRGGAGVWVRVVLAVLAGGAASGALTTIVMLRHIVWVESGVRDGLMGGVLFLPACAVVVAAARRAARARRGSVVARSDARGMWAVTAAAIAVATWLALPDGMAGETPRVALAMGGGALAVSVALFLGDAIALLGLRRTARAAEGMEVLERGADEAEGAVPAIDLGLGAEVRATMRPGAAAYRGKDRAAALLLGSFGEARRALWRGLAKKALACAVVVGALAVHTLAARPQGRLAYHEMVCEAGSALDCGIAAAMLREGAPEDLPRAVAYGAAATGPAPYDVNWPYDDAEPAARRDRAWIHAALLQRACEGGAINQCEPAVRAREAAHRQSD